MQNYLIGKFVRTALLHQRTVCVSLQKSSRFGRNKTKMGKKRQTHMDGFEVYFA